MLVARLSGAPPFTSDRPLVSPKLPVPGTNVCGLSERIGRSATSEKRPFSAYSALMLNCV